MGRRARSWWRAFALTLAAVAGRGLCERRLGVTELLRAAFGSYQVMVAPAPKLVRPA